MGLIKSINTMPHETYNNQRHREQIAQEQVRQLYANIPGTNFFNLPIAAILFWLVSLDVDNIRVYFSVAAFITVLLLRYGLFVAHQKNHDRLKTKHWLIIYITFCSAPLALVWSLSAISFFPYVKNDVQVTLLFTIILLCVISIPVLAIRLLNFIIFLCLAVSPIFIQILWLGSEEQKFLVLLACAFIFSAFFVGRQFNKTLTDSLHYRTESERLSDSLRTVNAHLSLANEDLERLSITDDLTGIANRRYFNKRFAEVWADHARESKNLCALMIDVDYFKDFNDTYGHLEGDKCLRQISEAMHSVIYRPRDFLARYGGEEFIILLPDTTLQGAEQIADRLHARVKDMNIEHKPKGFHNRLTVSIGLSNVTPKAGISKNTFLQRLDEALYEAKHSGRNTSKTLKMEDT